MTLAVKVALNPYTTNQPTNQPIANIFPVVHNVFFLFTNTYMYHHLSITRRQILDSSKLKLFADNHFKFDENERELSKQEENTVGKGEIARYRQFLLFPKWFQGRQKVSLCGNGLNLLLHNPVF